MTWRARLKIQPLCIIFININGISEAEIALTLKFKTKAFKNNNCFHRYVHIYVYDKKNTKFISYNYK